MAFRLGFAPQGGFNGPPQAPGFGNFRMQFRPGFRPQGGPATNGQTVEPDLKPTNESGLLFISNIDEKCPNDLMKDMLDTFGKVEKWTRIQGPDGNFPPFGFCGYEEQSSAVMAILTLNNFCIGNKRLNAKADEKAKKALVDFVVNDRISKRQPRKALGKELEPDEGDKELIVAARTKIRDLLRARVPELIHEEDDDLAFDDKKKSLDESKSHKRDSKRSEKKHRKRSHSRKHSKSRSRSRSKSNKKKRRRSSSRSSTSSRTFSDYEKPNRRRGSSAERQNGLDSDDSDVVMDRKEKKRELRRKDEDYLRMLKKTEERERRTSKQYEQEDTEENLRKKLLQKEAKKLAQFLEDYDDSRDDPKYYKGSLLSKRKREYEEECEADKKDREEELKEIKSIKAMILTERGENRGKSRENGSVNSSPQFSSTGQKPKSTQQSFQYSFVEEKQPESTPQTNGNEWTPIYDKPSTSQPTESTRPQGTGKVITTLQNKVLSQVNSVFAEDDPDEDHTHVIKKKIKPFEITAQDRIESMTAEERKQMVKELIDAIPTTKDAVFEYQLAWDYLDNEMIEQRIKPWLEKKICEYLGDDEPSLIEFICERVNNRIEAPKLLSDLRMIFDAEAENFTLKLWRLLIYQTEAKKSGLNMVSNKP